MVLKATVIFTFKEALLCIPPFFYSVPPCSVWKHQRRVETKFSLSLVVGSLAISLSAYSCTHMHHRSSPPVVDAHRIPSVLAMRPSAYLDYKPLILPFLFLPPFSSQSRRFISTLIRCKSLHPRIGSSLSSSVELFLSKLFETDCSTFIFRIRWL